MIDTLRSQIEKYLPNMKPGSTFLDAGCHTGEMFKIFHDKKFPIIYTGIESNADLYSQAVKSRGHLNCRFINDDFMNHHEKYDYVWCSQMTHNDNATSFRHLAGLAKKQLFYSHIIPCDGHLNVQNAVNIYQDERFRIYIS